MRPLDISDNTSPTTSGSSSYSATCTFRRVSACRTSNERGMFLNYVAFDGKRLSLTTGGGPVLIGHYMSSAEWRVSSALLASIASYVPESMIGVLPSPDRSREYENLMHPQWAAEWQSLSLEAVRDTELGGVVSSERGNVVFLPATRDEIEDCVYRTFAQNTCYIAPISCRRLVNSVAELEDELRKKARVEVDARYFDIDIIIHDSSIQDIVIDRVARIVQYFNQF